MAANSLDGEEYRGLRIARRLSSRRAARALIRCTPRVRASSERKDEVHQGSAIKGGRGALMGGRLQQNEERNSANKGRCVEPWPHRNRVHDGHRVIPPSTPRFRHTTFSSSVWFSLRRRLFPIFGIARQSIFNCVCSYAINPQLPLTHLHSLAAHLEQILGSKGPRVTFNSSEANLTFEANSRRVGPNYRIRSTSKRPNRVRRVLPRID